MRWLLLTPTTTGCMGCWSRQNYRLAFWRAAERDLGYRRFFDISNMIGLHMENEQVFNDTHTLVLRWLSGGCAWLGSASIILTVCAIHSRIWRGSSRAAPHAWVVVEKILQVRERMPESWPMAGTTGYDFLNRVGGLFIDPTSEAPLTRLYGEFTVVSADYPAMARECKEFVARDILGSELNRLTELFVEVCENDRRHRDYTRHELHEALVAVVAQILSLSHLLSRRSNQRQC